MPASLSKKGVWTSGAGSHQAHAIWSAKLTARGAGSACCEHAAVHVLAVSAMRLHTPGRPHDSSMSPFAARTSEKAATMLQDFVHHLRKALDEGHHHIGHASVPSDHSHPHQSQQDMTPATCEKVVRIFSPIQPRKHMALLYSWVSRTVPMAPYLPFEGNDVGIHPCCRALIARHVHKRRWRERPRSS